MSFLMVGTEIKLLNVFRSHYFHDLGAFYFTNKYFFLPGLDNFAIVVHN